MDDKIRRRRAGMATVVILVPCVAAADSPVIAEDRGTRPGTTVAAPAGSDAAVTQRFDALVEAAAERIAARRARGAASVTDVAALRAELSAASKQTDVLNAVVVKALLAQATAEAEAQAARRNSRHQIEALLAELDATDARNLMLADQVDALAEQLSELKSEIELLRRQALPDVPEATPERGVTALPPATPGPVTSPEPRRRPFAVVGSAMAATVEGFPGEDATLAQTPTAGEILAKAEPAAPPPATIELGRVHFDPGSASLTPGGERNAREAATRIAAMDIERVRIVGFTDTVGGAEGNLHLSLLRARAIAELLEASGISRNQIEVVGRGEGGVPEPTAEEVSEPLNRCAGIFVDIVHPK